MYTGNGITKVFPLPEGYDGSVVVLRMPGGKGIRMLQGDGYEVKDGAVRFFASVPSGVEVLFDELSAEEMMSGKSSGYVVIYADGSMKEIDDDPVLVLEESQRVLLEAKKLAEETKQASSEAVGVFGAC